MNISRINSTSFKGYLTLEDKNGEHYYNTDKIDYVANNIKDRGITFFGLEDALFVPYRRLFIPYSVIAPNKVLAAYNCAKSSPKAEVTLKTDGEFEIYY